jgi:TonB family protein
MSQTIMMTLRNSLFISIFVHVLIFGSALAFARYAGVAYPPRLDAVQVSLITPAGPEKDTGTPRSRERVTPIRENTVVEADQPVMRSEDVNDQSVSQQAEDAVVVGDLDADDEQLLSGPDTGLSDGEQSGLVTTEYLGLFEAIERVKRYPRLARERGMEGVVRIRFRLDPSGNVEHIKVVQSSGFKILDSASVSAVYRAAPMPYVNGWVDMPMKYVLK